MCQYSPPNEAKTTHLERNNCHRHHTQVYHRKRILSSDIIGSVYLNITAAEGLHLSKPEYKNPTPGTMIQTKAIDASTQAISPGL
jgi:hypothetical protein